MVLLTPAGYSMQRFSPSGEPVGGRPLLAKRPLCSECHFINSAAMDDRGRLAVLWGVYCATARNLFVQVFTPRGRPLTDRIPVGSTLPAALSSGFIALTNESTVAVVWRRESVEAPEEDGLYVWLYSCLKGARDAGRSHRNLSRRSRYLWRSRSREAEGAATSREAVTPFAKCSRLLPEERQCLEEPE